MINRVFLWLCTISLIFAALTPDAHAPAQPRKPGAEDNRPSPVRAAFPGASKGGWHIQRRLGDDFFSSINPVTRPNAFQMPLDAAPNRDASLVYFTATASKGFGLFRVALPDGAIQEIWTGLPFVAPVGIAIGSDGQKVYVADQQAGQTAGRSGMVFVVSASGGEPAALQGTEGTRPRGMDVVVEGGQEMIYFTGKDRIDGRPAVFKMPLSGTNSPLIVAKGAPLVEPDGVTVSETGIVYVADRSAAGSGLGTVFKISATSVSRIVERLPAGNPAGVALTSDDSVLLVSALQPDRDSAQVLLVDLTTLETGSVTKIFGQSPGAGGLHRARGTGVRVGGMDSFAWVSVPMGPIFKIMFTRE